MFAALTRLFRSFTGSDRRRAARYQVAHGASLRNASGHEHAARVLDVSHTGLRLLSPTPLDIDSAADLLLHFQGEALARRATVVRCTPEPYGGWEMGLRFAAGEESLEAVGRYFEFARWLSGHLNFACV